MDPSSGHGASFCKDLIPLSVDPQARLYDHSYLLEHELHPRVISCASSSFSSTSQEALHHLSVDVPIEVPISYFPKIFWQLRNEIEVISLHYRERTNFSDGALCKVINYSG